MLLNLHIQNASTGTAHLAPLSELALGIQMLAGIHAGVPGLRIPREVMDLYKVMKNGDSFRPVILKEVVLTLEALTTCGIADQQTLETAVRDRLETVAGRLAGDRLEQWLLADVRRERLVPCEQCQWSDRLRAAYVEEGMEMFNDAMDYAAALCNRS